MRTVFLLAACASFLSSGCSLDSEGQAKSNVGGSGGTGGSGGLDAAMGGAGGTTTGGSGGTTPVDASWPIDAAGGTGGAQPGDAAGDAVADAPSDTHADAPPDAGPEAGVETNCTNGVDDDGDGVADCADPDCSAIVVCVPQTPGGWLGPSFVRARAAEDAITDCGSMTQGNTYYVGLGAGGHTCPCACISPSGGSCAAPTASLYASEDCTADHASVSGAGCHGVGASTSTNGPGSVLAPVPSLQTPPACTPHASANIGEVSWNQALDLCEPPVAAGCDGGELCVPRPPAQVENAACIVRSGDKGCPPDFASKRTVYESFEDDRACTASGCACAPAVGATCGGKIRVHSTDDCSFTVGAFDLDGSCHKVSTVSNVLAVELAPGGPQGGQCAASGFGTPTGSVLPTGLQTICCSVGL